jgi:hypothetical protein
LGSFFHYKSSVNLWTTFFQVYSSIFILTKNGLGYSLGDFFTNSSGHPAGEAGNCAAGQRRHPSCRLPKCRKVQTIRVAGWHVYFNTPKIPIFIYFVSPKSLIETFGIFYGTYILWSFGIFCCNFGTFFHVFVSCAKKNLATLLVRPTLSDPNY